MVESRTDMFSKSILKIFLSLPRELIRLLLATANSFFGCMHRSSRSRSGFKINIPSMDLSFKKVSVVKRSVDGLHLRMPMVFKKNKSWSIVL